MSVAIDTAVRRPKRAAKRLAPLGCFTRFMLRNYTRHIFIVAVALLSISLTSDLSSWVWQVVRGQTGSDYGTLVFRIARVFVLRSTDLLALILPISCFLGALWTEVGLTYSRERLTIWNVGRSPLQCLVPILLLGAITGLIQFALDAYLRPAAVLSMEGRPDEANPDTSFTARDRWFVADGALVHARLSYGPPARLGQVTLYRMTSDGQLNAVMSARTATPDGDGKTWTLRNGWIWMPGAPSPANAPADSEVRAQQGFDALSVPLDLDPLWLSRYGIHAQYLKQDILRRIANAPEARYPTMEYKVWYEYRFSRALLPGGMALLAVSLALILIAYRLRPQAIIAIAVAGYAAHVLVKTSMVLGEHGVLPPAVAAWAVPVLLPLVCAVALLATDLYRRTLQLNAGRLRGAGGSVSVEPRPKSGSVAS